MGYIIKIRMITEEGLKKYLYKTSFIKPFSELKVELDRNNLIEHVDYEYDYEIFYNNKKLDIMYNIYFLDCKWPIIFKLKIN